MDYEWINHMENRWRKPPQGVQADRAADSIGLHSNGNLAAASVILPDVLLRPISIVPMDGEFCSPRRRQLPYIGTAWHCTLVRSTESEKE